MQKLVSFLSPITTGIIFLTPIVQAQAANTVTLVNHFNQSIAYTVGINPEVLPDLPVNFSLNPGQQIETSVVDVGKDEAYIRGAGEKGGSVFFGIELANNKVVFHGYISKNIAYSWQDTTVVFCTPEEYKTKKACI